MKVAKKMTEVKQQDTIKAMWQWQSSKIEAKKHHKGTAAWWRWSNMIVAKQHDSGKINMIVAVQNHACFPQVHVTSERKNLTNGIFTIHIYSFITFTWWELKTQVKLAIGEVSTEWKMCHTASAKSQELGRTTIANIAQVWQPLYILPPEFAATKVGVKLLCPNKRHQPRALSARNATVQQWI